MDITPEQQELAIIKEAFERVVDGFLYEQNNQQTQLALTKTIIDFARATVRNPREDLIKLTRMGSYTLEPGNFYTAMLFASARYKFDMPDYEELQNNTCEIKDRGRFSWEGGIMYFYPKAPLMSVKVTIAV